MSGISTDMINLLPMDFLSMLALMGIYYMCVHNYNLEMKRSYLYMCMYMYA